MKQFFQLILAFVLGTQFHAVAQPPARSQRAAKQASTVFLDSTGVRNLRLKMVEVEEQTFEETIFALGRIEVRPGYSAVLSSRIAGRVAKVDALPDHHVKKDDVLVVVESALPGNPPPQINLTAPMSGVVSEVNVVLGEPVNPDRALLRIIDLASVYGVARIPERSASRLREGMNAWIQVAGWPDQRWNARLEHIGVLADSESGTLEAAFHIDNKDLKLRPGMRGEFSIITSQREGVFSIPKAALQGEAANRFVYVADVSIPHAFVKVPVEIGASNDRFVEITRGLFPGDNVVTDGSYSLAHAGKGTISLKEALDAAHGHEHNEDGSEITPGSRKKENQKQEHKAKLSPLTIFSLIGNVVLLAALCVSAFRRRVGEPTSKE
jgi:multidrug efflux pump subunit AcrA (membrane-fusion protein)